MPELTLKDVLEGMADHETRLLNLEGQHTPSDASQSLKEDVPEVRDVKKRFYLTEYASREDVDKLRALFVNLKNQFNEHFSKKRPSRKEPF